jgi:hypothetical protein
MPALDILDDDSFSLSSLTAEVNKLPFVPGQVGAAGLFEADGVSTTTVLIEQMDGALSIVADTPRGSPGETINSDKRELKAVRVPHFQRNDTIMADEVQNVRAFGSETDLETVQDRVNSKLGRHTRDLDTTVELLRVGAIKGIVSGKSGTIQNLYTLFGVSQPSAIVWDLAADATKPRTLAMDLKNAIEDELDATNYTGLHVFCGHDFFKNMIDHKSIRETYLGLSGCCRASWPGR